MAKHHSLPSKSPFQTAVEATPDVARCYQSGLQALGGDSSKIVLSNTRLCEGSVAIDTCTATKYPQASRWDYAIGYDQKAYFVEVHPAETGQVDSVLKKLAWIAQWLNASAPALNAIKAEQPFYWIASGRVNILPGSPQQRRLAASGIKLCSILHLPPK